MKGEDFLSEHTRAEDIILGSLGYGEDAHIVEIEITSQGFRGKGAWSDGEEFDFESDDDVDDLQQWALMLLVTKK